MKKKWMRCLAAVSLIAVMGTGTILKAHEEEMAGKTGGGAFVDYREKPMKLLRIRQRQ